MLDASQVTEQLAEAREYADRIGMLEQLEQQLRVLNEYSEHGDRGKTCCRLYPDLAPYSFGFLMTVRREAGLYRNWFNGALLFHGPHDRGGDGGAPTYSTCLQPTVGWSIHT